MARPRKLTSTAESRHTTAGRRVFLLGGTALVIAASALAAQRLPWQSTSSSDVPAVRYLYPEQIQIPAGKPSEVELHFKIRDGLHINSHTPLEKSLIRTELTIAEPHGVEIRSVDFTPGADYTLKSLPGAKLSVYTGELILRARLSAAAGEHLVEGALRYQACDTDSCYPPKQAPVALDVIAR